MQEVDSKFYCHCIGDISCFYTLDSYWHSYNAGDLLAQQEDFGNDLGNYRKCILYTKLLKALYEV